MNRVPLLVIALLLTACERPMPFEPAEVLAENPERLEELRLQCRADRSKLGMPNAMQSPMPCACASWARAHPTPHTRSRGSRYSSLGDKWGTTLHFASLLLSSNGCWYEHRVMCVGLYSRHLRERAIALSSLLTARCVHYTNAVSRGALKSSRRAWHNRSPRSLLPRTQGTRSGAPVPAFRHVTLLLGNHLISGHRQNNQPRLLRFSTAHCEHGDRHFAYRTCHSACSYLIFAYLKFPSSQCP